MESEAGVRGWESVMGVPVWVANRLQQALQPRGHMETLGRPVWHIPAQSGKKKKKKKREEKKREISE